MFNFFKKFYIFFKNKFVNIINWMLRSNIVKMIILFFDSKNKEIIFIRYIFGTLTIVGDYKTYKIEINSNSLYKELSNRDFIKNSHVEIYDILLPVDIKKRFSFLYLESNTLETLSNSLDFITSYEYISNIFKKNIIKNNSIYIKKFNNIIDSIKFISRSHDEFIILKDLFTNMFEEEEYLIPSHGDLHIGNILKSQDKYYLIDLDCFRNIQFVWMDEIYFIIELIVFEKSEQYSNWIDIIEKIMSGDKILFKYKKYFKYFNFENPYLQLLIYILDRIDQEKIHTNYDLGIMHKIIDLIYRRVNDTKYNT